MIEKLINAAPLQPVLSRRGFIFGISALAGGLVLGTPAAFAQAGCDAPTPAATKPGQPELTAWVVIQSDDSVLIRIARLDMGQGIFTSLPMLVAEELECDWTRVRPEYAPVAEHLARKQAHASKQNPYEFRRPLLARAPRTLAVLDEAARRANWGNAPAGVHQGIAVVEFDDAVCAQVAEISIDKEGGVKVRRVVCVIDPIFAVHPDTIAAQMEGCIIQVLGAALTGEITFKAGRTEQSNFLDYPLPRIRETPRIETYTVASGTDAGQPWGAVGETGVPPPAPALVNAVFAATGSGCGRCR